MSERGDLEQLARSAARYAIHAMVLFGFDRGVAPKLNARRIGAPLLFGRLWREAGCATVLANLLAEGAPSSRRRDYNQVRPHSARGCLTREAALIRSAGDRLRNPDQLRRSPANIATAKAVSTSRALIIREGSTWSSSASTPYSALA